MLEHMHVHVLYMSCTVHVYYTVRVPCNAYRNNAVEQGGDFIVDSVRGEEETSMDQILI
jgi:hypothetical protein